MSVTLLWWGISICVVWNVTSFRLMQHAKVVGASSHRLQLTGAEATEVVVAIASGVALFKVGVYFNIQLQTAQLMSSITPGTRVVELAAKETKNVYYLPANVTYTAIYEGEGKSSEERRKSEKAFQKISSNVVDVVNRDGLNIRSQVRATSKALPSASADCVLSLGALQRAGTSEQKTELVDEALRIVRAGGQFMFVEPNRDNVALDLILKILDTKKIDTKKGKTAPKKRRSAKQGMKEPDLELQPTTAASIPTQTFVISSERVVRADESPASALITVPRVDYKIVQNLFAPYVVGTIQMPV